MTKAEALLNEKIKNGREYRNALEFRAEQGSEEKMTVRGYATTFNEPYLLYDLGNYKVYEIIDSHAFDDCDMSDVIMQYDHEGRVFARTSNGTLRLQSDEHGMLIEADLSGTTIGRQLYEEIKGGYTHKMSFGFCVGEHKREITEDNENGITTVTRTITKIKKLYDVSAVSIPANDHTEISARCYCDGVIEELKAERLSAERNIKQKAVRALLLAAKI